MRIAVLLAIAGVFATVAAQAEEEYKSIRRAEAQAAWAESGMPIYDFLGDAKSLMGKTVSVRGVAECLTDIHCYLQSLKIRRCKWLLNRLLCPATNCRNSWPATPAR